MSSKEFMAGIDPQVKTIIDSYEISPFNRWGAYNANKEKHILRPDVLIAYGNPEVVAKGQEAYIQSLEAKKEAKTAVAVPAEGAAATAAPAAAPAAKPEAKKEEKKKK